MWLVGWNDVAAISNPPPAVKGEATPEAKSTDHKAWPGWLVGTILLCKGQR